jgi:N-acetylneuraminate synthase
MNPETWADMMLQVRTLERSLGSGDKFVTPNEQETYQLQRRCLRAARDIKADEIFSADMVEPLRPATPGAVMAWEVEDVVGKKARIDMPYGKELRWADLGE